MAALIDFHCHLDLYPDTAGSFGAAKASDAYVLSVTTTPSAWRGTLARAEGARRTRTALGLHPQLAHQRESECALFETLLPETRYVGEIGLDGSVEYRAHSAPQLRVFERTLRACERAGGRVLSIHSRGAAAEVLQVLGRHPSAGVAILHWFTGTKSELRAAVEQGCWFSVGPAMLTAQKGRDLASAMPRDRVLTETDGPFAKVGGQPLRPGEVGTALEALACLWGTGVEGARHQVHENLRGLVK